MRRSIKKLLLAGLGMLYCITVDSQTFNWTGYPSNAASWNPSATFNVTTSTAGGGSFDRRQSAAAGVSPISGTAGNVAQNCSNYTGLRLEMSGAGNSAGTAVWNNSITVTMTFPTFLCAPVTFNIYDITETFWNDGSANYVNYQDKVTISSTDHLGAAVLPTAVTTGPIDNTVAGSSRVLTANGTNGQCANQAISVGVAGQRIQTITIVYSNQDLPTHCPSPVGSPPRYGISQYQYVFISPITGTAPPTASVSAAALACGSSTTTLTASTSAGSPTYSWTGPGGSTIVSPSSASTSVTGAGTYTVTINPGGCSSTATYTLTPSGTPPNVTAAASQAVTCTTPTISASSSTSPVTFSWAGPGIVSGGTTATPTINAAGTYTVTVTNTSTGCVNTATVAATINTTPPSVTSSGSNNINCSTPSATLTGVSAGNTMVWNGGALSNAANPASVTAAGTYTVTATDASNGCTNTSTVVVSANTTPPAVSSSGSGNLTCSVTSSTLTGISAGNTMVWNGGSLSNAANPATVTAAGTYTVTATSASNGCTNTSTVVVSSNTIPPSVSSSGSGNLSCSVTSSTLTGISAGNAMVWNGGSLSNAANPATVTAAGTYTVTATSATNGCTNTSTVVINSNTIPPVLSSSSSGDLSCSMLSAALTGTSAGNTMVWNGGTLSNAANPATVTAAGTYTVTATDAGNGCTNTSTVTVSSNTTAPSISAVSSNDIDCAVTSATLNGTSPGNTMVWNGGTLLNEPNPATVSAAGTYTVTATDVSNGCTASTSVTVNASGALPDISIATPSQITCLVTSVTLTGSSATPGVAFSWTGGPASASYPVSTAATYTLTVTDPGNGCSATQTVVVTNDTTPPAVTSSVSGIITCAVASVTLTGTSAGNTMLWNGGALINAANPATVSSPGTYTVTSTDAANGCTNTSIVIVAVDTAAPSVSSANSNNIDCVTTSATLTGTSAGNTMVWNGGTLVNAPDPATVTAAGTYTVTATDASNGCTASSVVVVSAVGTLPDISISTPSQITCIAGTVSLSGNSTTAGVGYQWTGGPSTAAYNVTAPGTYTLTVTDPGTGCSAQQTVTVSSNTVSPTVTAGSPLVLGCVPASGIISASSGTAGANYSWTGAGIVGSAAVSNPTVNAAGTYSVTVTDPANGCTATTTVNVTSNIAVPNVTAGPALSLNCSVLSGTISAASTTSGITYSWTGPGITSGGSTAAPAVNAAGTYTVTVTDPSNGCTNTATVNAVSNIAPPDVTAGPDAVISCSAGTAGISAGSSTAGVMYNWTGPGIITGAGTATPSVNSPGTYTVTVTDPSNGCSSDTIVTVAISAGPTANAGVDISISAGVSATLTASGGGTYLWSTGATTNMIIVSPTVTTDYCVTVTDSLACSDTACVRVVVDNPCPGTKDLQVPTAFSPNGDGHNDQICLQGWSDCITEFKITIYDRWGEKVFESNDPAFCWDGIFKGKMLDPAVFVFYVTAELPSKETVTKQGNISLIR